MCYTTQGLSVATNSKLAESRPATKWKFRECLHEMGLVLPMPASAPMIYKRRSAHLKQRLPPLSFCLGPMLGDVGGIHIDAIVPSSVPVPLGLHQGARTAEYEDLCEMVMVIRAIAQCEFWKHSPFLKLL